MSEDIGLTEEEEALRRGWCWICLTERLHNARDTVEALELLAEDAGFREVAKQIYEARLRLSEAIQALLLCRPKQPSSKGTDR